MLTHRQQNFYEWRHMMVAREALAMGGTYKIGQKGGKMIPSEGGKLGFWSWTNFLPRNWGDKKCLKSYPNFTDSSIFITNNPVLCHTYTLIFMTRIQHVCITCQFNSIPSKFFPEENMKLNRINIFFICRENFWESNYWSWRYAEGDKSDNHRSDFFASSLKCLCSYLAHSMQCIKHNKLLGSLSIFYQ